MWEYNTPFRTPINIAKAQAGQEPSGPQNFKDLLVYKECLGNSSCYGVFPSFSEKEIEDTGVIATLKEYLLKGDEVAESVFRRLYSGKQPRE